MLRLRGLFRRCRRLQFASCEHVRRLEHVPGLCRGAGQYVRNRRAPVQPIGTGRRAFIRAAFGGASSGYAGLTAAQQDAWTSFAASHPITDALGQSITLTGHQMYVALYVNNTNVGFAPSATPPAVLDTTSILPVAMTFGIAAGIAVAFTAADGAGKFAAALTRPLSPARRFIKTFWQPPGVNGYDTDDSTPWAYATASYAAQFGAPTVGQRVFCKITHYTSSGWIKEVTIVSALVTA